MIMWLRTFLIQSLTIFIIKGMGGGTLKNFENMIWSKSCWSKRSTQWANFLVGPGGPKPLGAPVFPSKVANSSK